RKRTNLRGVCTATCDTGACTPVIEAVTMSDDPSPPPSRRQVLKGLGVLGGVAALAGVGVLAWPSSSTESDVARPEQSRLDALADAVTPGGPGKDGIPAIDEPRFVSAAEAEFLQADEPVFGLVHRGVVRAYPQ